MKIISLILMCPFLLSGQIIEPIFHEDIPAKHRPIYHFVKFKLVQAEIDLDESTDIKTYWMSQAKIESYQEVLDYIIERSDKDNG